jgi:methyl-accepting chemotaxis protein
MAAQAEMARRQCRRAQLPHGRHRVPGEYGRMVADSNQLVASSNAVTQRLVEVMQRYAVGDLSVDMEALPGEKAVFTAAMATTKSNLAAINEQIQQLAPPRRPATSLCAAMPSASTTISAAWWRPSTP